MLRRRGITQVRPLHGGLNQWKELGFPTSTLVSVEAAARAEHKESASEPSIEALPPIAEEVAKSSTATVKQRKADGV